MPIGPRDYQFSIDSISSNTVGSAVALDDVMECSGIQVNAIMADTTTLGDEIASEGSVGVREFPRITLKGFFEAGATGDYQRLGPVADAATPPRTFTITHRTGVTQALEVSVVSKKLTPDARGHIMYEVELAAASGAATGYVETGV